MLGSKKTRRRRTPEPLAPPLPPPPAAPAAVSAPVPALAHRSTSLPLATPPSSPRPCTEAHLQAAREPPPPSTSADAPQPPPLVELGSDAPWSPAPPCVVGAPLSPGPAAPAVAPPSPPPPSAADHLPSPSGAVRSPGVVTDHGRPPTSAQLPARGASRKDEDLGTDVSPLSPSGPSSSLTSTLSPNAAPFHPGTGRSKARRWADADIVDTPDSDTAPISYLDALCRASLPPRLSPRPEPSLPHTRHSSSGYAGVVPGRSGGRRRRHHPQVVHGMPIQPLEGRIPARQRLGRRGRRWCDRPRPQLMGIGVTRFFRVG